MPLMSFQPAAGSFDSSRMVRQSANNCPVVMRWSPPCAVGGILLCRRRTPGVSPIFFRLGQNEDGTRMRSGEPPVTLKWVIFAGICAGSVASGRTVAHFVDFVIADD